MVNPIWPNHNIDVPSLEICSGPAHPPCAEEGLPSPHTDHQAAAGAAAQGLLALFDPIRHALGDHDGGGVRIGTHHIGHDRGVDHPQALQTVHPTVLVHHRHGV